MVGVLAHKISGFFSDIKEVTEWGHSFQPNLSKLTAEPVAS